MKYGAVKCLIICCFLWLKIPAEGCRVWTRGGDSPGGRDTREEPGWSRPALAVSEAGLPQIHQTVQLPAAGGANRSSVHSLPRGQGQHASGPHSLPNLHQVQILLASASASTGIFAYCDVFFSMLKTTNRLDLSLAPIDRPLCSLSPCFVPHVTGHNDVICVQHD